MELSDENLLKIQSTAREILTVIDRVCKEAGTPWYLFYGSALGAVRHGGFIPWDDDADIIMFRADYEKLRAYWLAHPVEGYFFQDIFTDPGYNIKITKIRKDNTSFVESYVKDRKMHHGLFVDIFVLDDYVKSPFWRRVGEYITMFDYNAVRSYKADNRLGKLIYPITNVLFRGGHIYNFWYKHIFPRLKKDEGMCSDIASFTNSKKYDFRREWFGEPKYVPFDDCSFPIPQDAASVLTSCYGDFMTPPPPEKQKGHHNFHKLSFTEGYSPDGQPD